jgi:subtilisin-like proprotein convertase family protein
MKHSKMTARIAVLAVGAATLVAASAATATLATAASGTFPQTTAIAIPEVGKANPYPTDVVVSGLPVGILDVNVTLKGLTHTYLQDLDVLLVGPGPTGRSVVLMSDAGGTSGVSAVNLTLDDQAASPAPQGLLASGSYKPTNYDAGDVFPAPAPNTPPAPALSAFNGTDPNGTWRLMVVDDGSYDSGAIAGGWSLTITTVDRAGVPTLTSPVGGSTSLNGVVDFGGIAAAGSTVRILDGSTQVAVTDANSSGVYLVRLAGPASDGVHNYTATATANDTFNNASSPSAPVHLVVDTVAPVGGMTIDGGAAQTNAAAVTLGLAATDAAPTTGLSLMRFSNDAVTWSGFEPYNTAKAWTLAAGDGPKTVWAQFKDNAGNVSVAATAAIVLDTAAPGGTVTINKGAALSGRTVVALDLSATDATSGVAQMRFSNDGATWSAYEPYGATKTWTLTSGDGPKPVFAQFTDRVGNVSVAATAAIVLDTASPGGRVTINKGTAYSGRTAVTLGLAATDATSSVTQMRFSNDGATWSAYEPFATTRAWSLRPGDGRKTVSAQFADSLGNVSVTATDTIVLDTVLPKVVRTVPANRRDRARTTANITAMFSEAMSPASMTRSSVRVVRVGTSKSIAGRVSYSSTLRTVTFNPTRRLAAGTAYNVVISAVRDATGNLLDQLSKSGVQSMTWSFNTR